MGQFQLACGARPQGARLERMQASPRWGGDRFLDVLQREEPKNWSALREFLAGGSRYRKPSEPPPIHKPKPEDLARPHPSGLRITWLGHSTSLIDIDGHRVLLDPVLGMRASPVSWAGPKRFHEAPVKAEELPPLDAVAISHDHYDHLDYPTVMALAKTEVPFIVPLGVGAHLEHWGIPPERITELDWWEATQVGKLSIVATPARHFSGRAPTMSDRDRTLWAGWAILGPRHRLYFSGDTAMFPGFEQIGRRLGPFDIAMVEAGAYNALWRDVHIGPEQAVLAAALVRSDLLLPVHWATFDLALHGWTEPIERILAAAARGSLRVATPRPGESVVPSEPIPTARWWPELPYEAAVDKPLLSTGLDDALVMRVQALYAPA